MLHLPFKKIVLLTSSFFLPLTIGGQIIPADQKWSADLKTYTLAPDMSGDTGDCTQTTPLAMGLAFSATTSVLRTAIRRKLPLLTERFNEREL